MSEMARMNFRKIEITNVSVARCEGSAYMKDTPYKWHNKKASLPDRQQVLPSGKTG